MTNNLWIVLIIAAFVILNWIIWRIRRAIRNEPPSGTINYTQMFRKPYPPPGYKDTHNRCAYCGSIITRELWCDNCGAQHR